MAEPAAVDTLGYEQARDELVEVVRALEAGGLSLDDSVALWERGEALARAAVTEMFHLGRAGQLGHGETWLDTLRAHVLDRMAHRIAIDDLARAAGLSRTHFNRTFRRATGQSPYRWVLGLKLGYAKRLLVHGVPCAEVAQVTGFADQAHFSRSFRAETGAAPAHWARAQAAGPNGPIVQDNPSR